jgi:hypothetical protein
MVILRRANMVASWPAVKRFDSAPSSDASPSTKFSPSGDSRRGFFVSRHGKGSRRQPRHHLKDLLMTTMRAKFIVSTVTKHAGPSEVVKFNAVAKSSAYPADGSDEDNTYAKWSPSAECSISITNPALHGKFEPGQKFYVDFTPA